MKWDLFEILIKNTIGIVVTTWVLEQDDFAYIIEVYILVLDNICVMKVEPETVAKRAIQSPKNGYKP